MIWPLALFGAVTLTAPPCTAPAAPVDSTLVALYEGGATFETFLAEARRRREAWHANYAHAVVPPDLLQRLQAVPGHWRLLVVAIDGCSDSVSTIPYVAKLVESTDALEMRIVDSGVGRGVMESHRTPDARAATPTLVLLNEDGDEVGCFIERPQPLVSWLEEHGSGLGNQAFYEAKMEWYAGDAGISTVRQLVEMLEAADRGAPVCG